VSLRRLLLAAAAALALAPACGGQPQRWVELAPAAAGGGVEVRKLGAQADVQARPYQPPPGRLCVTYTISARSLDGSRHELRPDAFRTPRGSLLAALGPCGRPQLDPTWLDGSPRQLTLTVLTSAGLPEPLWVRLPAGRASPPSG